MKIRLFLLLAILLTACAERMPDPLAPTSALLVPQVTEKVVRMATATLPPDLNVEKTAIPNQTVTAKDKVLDTPAGNLMFRSARFVDEVHGVKPYANSKILLVILERTDGAPIDLQQFNDAGLHFLVRGDDGSESVSSMGGLVGSEFALGFQVPESVKTFFLIWPDMAVTEISVQ